MSKKIVRVDGGSSGRCAHCNGKLDYSWWHYYSDGTQAMLCSACSTADKDAS